ncbi:ATP-dependent Clp protease adapter protein ClpS [mine drainage metagenome]|uniref:ATP-dependent Clp protease adapter protein ClpS n=1 Tax=mine drainage metagenome TaxID=410659 RepID=A0A1J5PEG8_9ZZZZ
MYIGDPAPPGRRRPAAYSGAVPIEIAPAHHELAEASTASASPWLTIVWNDPVNLMSYVTYVFQTYFGYSQTRAETLMRQVHEDGKAVVSHGNREKVEVDVQAMHGYGLWATMQRGDE